MTKSEIRSQKERQRKIRGDKEVPKTTSDHVSAHSSPPNDLANLLAGIKEPSDIEKNHWASKFRCHLERVNLESVLDFVIACNVLKLQELRQHQNNEVNYKEKFELLTAIEQIFLSDQSAQPIELNNDILRKDISDKMQCLSDAYEESCDQPDRKDIIDALDLIWQARCDLKVWRELEKEYSAFVRSPSVRLITTLHNVGVS